VVRSALGGCLISDAIQARRSEGGTVSSIPL
jgi:hypothetical protein